MGYLILWLSSLAGRILAVATMCALAAHEKRPWRQVFWPVLIFVNMLLWGLLLTAFGGLLYFQEIRPLWLFWYELLLTGSFIIGGWKVLRTGLGKKGETRAARSWPWGRLAAAFGLVVAVHFGTTALMGFNIRVKLAGYRSMAALKAQNILPRRWPDSQNAFRLYQRAAETLGGSKTRPAWFRYANDPDFSAPLDGVNRFLARKKEALDLVRRAAAAPGYYVDTDVTNLLDSPIPQYTFYLDLERLLALKARSQVAAGNAAGALRTLARIGVMADHLRSMPTMISLMVSLRLDKARVSMLEHVLARVSMAPADLVTLPVEPSFSVRPYFRNVLSLEECILIEGLNSLELHDQMPYWVQFIDQLGIAFWHVYLLPSELAERRLLFERVKASVGKPFHEFRKEFISFKRSRAKGRGGPVTSILFYRTDLPFAGYMARVEAAEARRRLADLALAAAMYKAAWGRYPDRLEDLVPDYITEIPKDPFDGLALKMKALNDGLDLCARGIDPEDEIFSTGSDGPIHFYLGRAAYEKHRVKPALEERQNDFGNKRK